MSGKSLSNLLFIQNDKKSEPFRNHILTGRERHTHARPDNVGYPARAIRTKDFLFILNFKPERWPAGDPAPENPGKSLEPGYHDIDNSPTKLFLMEKRNKYPQQFRMGYEKRPSEELYRIKSDPGCTQNLADDPKFQAIKKELRSKLEKELSSQGDPRMTGKGDVFESYPRFGGMRQFPGFNEKGKYNPKYQ